MERQNHETVPTTINDENVPSDANRSTANRNRNNNATSILGSLERLVETSFKPNTTSVDMVVAQQVMMAKRALASSRGGNTSGGGNASSRGGDVSNEGEHEHEDKRARMDEDDEWTCSSSPPVTTPTPTVAELKFLKYSELAKELSSSR